MNEHDVKQIISGEYGSYAIEASTMTHEQFAEIHNQDIRIWGKPPSYWCVTVDETDYLWRIKDGVYDGYDKCFCKESK